LFALQQTLRDKAATAEAYDPEAKLALERAAAAITELIEKLQTVSDRAALVAAAEALLDDAGQGAALLGGPIQPRPNRPFDLASGRAFAHDKFECVIGSDVAEKLNLKLGDTIQAEHGIVEAREAEHHEEKWVVVGILKPTFTAFDRLLFIPLTSFYAIPVHEEALAEMSARTEEYRRAQGTAHNAPAPATTQAGHDADGGEDHDEHHEHHYRMEGDHIVLDLPRAQWKLSSVIVRSREATLKLLWDYRQTPDAMAVNPATEMRQFSETFLRGSSLVLLLLAILVTVVAAVSILVSIYNSIAARRREIAILRALGATRNRILSIICLEAGTIGLIGTICGFVLGVGLAGIGSIAVNRSMGEGINWLGVSIWELIYLAGAVVLSVLSGLVPAMKAYSTPVATNLVGE
jgi:putative ABC transport system permease protein